MSNSTTIPSRWQTDWLSEHAHQKIAVDTFRQEYPGNPWPPIPLPYTVETSTLTDLDIARIVRAVLVAMDERDKPSILDVTPADVRRWMPR